MNKKLNARTKKFELSRETLRNLEDGSAREIVAGAISISCTTTCHTPCPMCNA
jgi:hypothetical protein